MTIYIDSDCKCHTVPGESLSAVETDFFEGKAPGYIAGYRFVPAGKTWTRADGVVFSGEMICPWKDWAELDIIQQAYEREQVKSLKGQNEELLSTIAQMVEEVYESDLDVIGGE